MLLKSKLHQAFDKPWENPAMQHRPQHQAVLRAEGLAAEA
jgi:hypothetical protein